MSLTATLGPIRSTTPRVAGAINPISTFSALLADVKGAGLLARTRIFYISVFTTLVLALGGAITGFLLLGDSWFQLIIAGVLGIIFTQFAFLGHEASHRQVFESGKANDRVGRVLSSGHRRHQLLLVDEQALPPPRQPEHGRQGPRHRGRHDLVPRRGCRGRPRPPRLHHPPSGRVLHPAARLRGPEPARQVVRPHLRPRQGRRPRTRDHAHRRCGSASSSPRCSSCSRSAWRSRSSASRWPSSASTWAPRSPRTTSAWTSSPPAPRWTSSTSRCAPAATSAADAG